MIPLEKIDWGRRQLERGRGGGHPEGERARGERRVEAAVHVVDERRRIRPVSLDLLLLVDSDSLLFQVALLFSDPETQLLEFLSVTISLLGSLGLLLLSALDLKTSLLVLSDDSLGIELFLLTSESLLLLTFPMKGDGLFDGRADLLLEGESLFLELGLKEGVVDGRSSRSREGRDALELLSLKVDLVLKGLFFFLSPLDPGIDV